MKKLPCVSLCLLAAVCLAAAECRKNTNAYVAPTERGEPFLLKNGLTNYVVTWRYTNPSPTQPGTVLVGMPAPVNATGFSRKDFTSIVLNGIDSRVLEPKKFKMFNDETSSGVDVHYNFDGVPMIQRFAVSDASPLLSMTWRRGVGKPVRPIESLSIRFTVLPCASGRARDSYAREVVTPAEKYQPRGKLRWRKQKLAPRDAFLVLQDSKYQSGPQSPNAGPVVLCPGWKSILSGTVRFGVHQDVYVDFKLDPTAESWSFGLLDSEAKRSNEGFAAFLRELKLVP